MKDYSLTQIQLRVKKIWIQEFHKFCMSELDETSACVMDDLLKFEADQRTIQIIANSFAFAELNDARNRVTYRTKFMCNLGYLYPERFEKLTNCDNPKALMDALEKTSYHRTLHGVQLTNEVAEGQQENMGGSDDQFDFAQAKEASAKYSMAFENAFHFGVFYAYLKLKDLEIKNVSWLSDLVSMNLGKGNVAEWQRYTVPFTYHNN
jgi:V-type H+-transporting ATPase subunit d